MSVYDDIRSCFETKLAGIVGIPSIAYENVNFTPTTNTPWIECRMLYSSRVPSVMGLNTSTNKPHQQRYRGMFRIMLHYPEGVGSGASQDMVDTIISNFEASVDLSFTNADPKTVFVTVEYAEQMGAYKNSPWYVTPINISWYCYDT